jgi:LacI family transcriptional regulator
VARWRAIRAVARQMEIELQPELIAQLEGDQPTHEPGYHATLRLLCGSGDFSALFAFNDVSAIGAIRAIRDRGLRVPRDISVVGFDDVQSAAFQNPALTTIRQPLHDMGALAAKSLLAQISSQISREAVPRQIVVDPDLVVRESTAAASPRRSGRR